MEYRVLGRTGLLVSALAFGASALGAADGDAGRDRTSRALVDACLAAGITLFDTADTYQQGRSEEVLGRSLAGHRDDVLIATKLHARTGGGPNDLGQSRHHILRACEASLRRLNTSWIDLYQVHGFDALTDPEESLGALAVTDQTGPGVTVMSGPTWLNGGPG